MRLSPRRRITAFGLAAFAVGLVGPGFVDVLRGHGIICGSSLPGAASLCGAGSTSLFLRVVVFVLLGLLLLALWGIAMWCLRPFRELIAPMAQVGPQNLGFRLRATGPREEYRALADSIDAMMDRVAAGYEGQRRFAANASHELRTPLAVQRALIEVSLAGALTLEQLELVTRQLLATNERNEQLIEGLLVLSESDQGLVSRSPQRLDEIVAAVVATHQAASAAAHVSMKAELSPRIVNGERVLLERLVTNLVQNAIKYNRPGGHLHVVVGPTPALVVSNTGPAVPAEAVAGLFEPFRRLSGDRVSHGGGAGLGLTIARSIAQAHDGRISARPRDDDGLRVEVELP
ncbi:MAG: integral rane sensor signal transduction histidine kinase [Pseudonocardiales bacterium]|nr:integral rane sensor signal transduction histidine kinase [Pseudonocardiales bacterium]